MAAALTLGWNILATWVSNHVVWLLGRTGAFAPLRCTSCPRRTCMRPTLAATSLRAWSQTSRPATSGSLCCPPPECCPLDARYASFQSSAFRMQGVPSSRVLHSGGKVQYAGARYSSQELGTLHRSKVQYARARYSSQEQGSVRRSKVRGLEGMRWRAASELRSLSSGWDWCGCLLGHGRRLDLRRNHIFDACRPQTYEMRS